MQELQMKQYPSIDLISSAEKRLNLWGILLWKLSSIFHWKKESPSKANLNQANHSKLLPSNSAKPLHQSAGRLEGTSSKKKAAVMVDNSKTASIALPAPSKMSAKELYRAHVSYAATVSNVWIFVLPTARKFVKNWQTHRMYVTVVKNASNVL